MAQSNASQSKQSEDNSSYFTHISAEEYRRSFAGGTLNENQPKKVVTNVEERSSVQSEQIKSSKTPSSVEPIKALPTNISEPKNTPIAATPSITEEVKPEISSQQPISISHVEEDKKQEYALESLQYRIVGEVFHSYVIVERGSEMLLIDKHAAHERIIFEQLKAGLKDVKINSQMLMIPIEIMMTSDEIQAICDYRAEIEAVGFEFTVGKYSLSIVAIPEGIDAEGIVDMLLVMAERIKSGTGSVGLTKDIIFEKALYQASCKAAIKAGREYSREQIKRIVDKLMEIPDITVCPHGRPVAMILDKKNLDRQFERT
jgi:DNA mismatch repair protein MutL